MAETAIDIESDPFKNYYPPETGVTPEVAPAEEKEVQVAEAPPAVPTELPEKYYAPEKKAIDIGRPPMPSVTGGKQDAGPPSDPNKFDDEEEYKAAAADWRQKWGTLREHAGLHEPIVDKNRYTYADDPEYTKLLEMQDILSRMDPKKKREYGPMVAATERRVLQNTANRNAEAIRADRDKRTEELRNIDSRPETVEATMNTARVVDGTLGTLRSRYETTAANPRTKAGAQAEFTLKTSPLSTMGNEGPDGKITYEPFRDIVTKIAKMNGIPADTATLEALQIGTPIWKDDNGQFGVGVNGRRGKGALNFDVLGHDLRGNFIIKMRSGRQLRVDADSLDQLDRARLRGYKASAELDAERAKKKEEWERMGPVGRLWQGITQ